ncbi:MAG: hypothetical protein J5545_06360 [Bacteroidaceae bacterium]|nr:hypothetical protein [Bacteroidaceae bacterium]
MKTLLKSLLTASLLLASMTATAQCVKLEKRLAMLISEYGEEFCTDKTINETRDLNKPNRPLTSKCEMYYFTLKKKDSYQRELLDEMLRAMETEGREDLNCYSFNSMSESSNGDILGEMRRLMIGEDPENYISIGKDYNHFYNVNAIDTADVTKSHRYAYAVEWREKGKTIDVRYIVTYAKIPPATTTITQPSWPYLDLGRSRIPKKNGPIQAPNNPRVWWLGKDYSMESADSLIREAERKLKEGEERFEKAKRSISLSHIRKVSQPKFQTDDSIVAWSDTLEHEYDPVTDVIVRLHQGQLVNSDDLLCNENILLIFSQLKQQFLAGQNTEFNAISIYTLCKRAREYGFFTDSNAKAELEQLKRDINLMKSKSQGDTLRGYLQMALAQLEKIG